MTDKNLSSCNNGMVGSSDVTKLMKSLEVMVDSQSEFPGNSSTSGFKY